MFLFANLPFRWRVVSVARTLLLLMQCVRHIRTSLCVVLEVLYVELEWDAKHGQVFYYNIRHTVKCFRYVNRARYTLVFVNFVRPVCMSCTRGQRASKNTHQRARASCSQIPHAVTNGQCFFSLVHSFIHLLLFFSFVFFSGRHSPHPNRLESVSVECVAKLRGNTFFAIIFCCVFACNDSLPWISWMVILLASHV